MELKKRLKVSLLFVLGLFLLFVLAFDIKTISGYSMFPSLVDGEKILIFKAAYKLPRFFSFKGAFTYNNIKKNDIVIFRKDGRFVVKRVALVSEEPLSIQMYKDEPFLCLERFCLKLQPESYLTITANGRLKTVPKGFCLVLGDMLRLSEDSRNYGFVCENDILGKVLFK